MSTAGVKLPDSVLVLERGWLSSNNIVFFEGDEAALAARLAARGAVTDAIEGRPAIYHRAVADAFRAFAAADPSGIARIDALGAPADVHGRILTALGDLLDGAGA